jgi:MtrB/PioB family decaheme-associated outer membrane protein
MTMHPHSHALALSVLAAALLLAFGPARAADDEMTSLIKPESTVRLGAAYQSADNLRFGQYSGLTDKGGVLLLDFDYVKRDDDSGTWLRFNGRNLGTHSRELGAEHERQGDWRYFIEYNQIPRYEPLTINTGLSGIGSTTQTQNGTALRDIQLSTQRDRTTLGFNKKLAGGFEFQLRLRNEDKDGSRLFGRGNGLFLTEPIDSRTQQIDATVSYTGKQLQLTGGYYGTAFANRNAAIHFVTSPTTSTDVALSPDSESHQLYVSGGYSFAPTTRGTFKVSYGTARQNEDFFTAPTFAGNTQTSLHGRLDTTAVQLGLSARPMPKLSLLANLRYEERDDQTPRFQFITASTGRDGFNTPFSRNSVVGKLEASYQLPDGYRFTGGIDEDRRKRTTLPIRQASWREKNDETTYRMELRRSLSETLNGAVSYLHSDRGGSDYQPANNNAATDFIDPIHFADRKRNKVRLSLDWIPTEALSLQFMLDGARDTYDGRPLGPESGKARFWSIDSTYSVSEDWQALAWVSSDDTHINQATNTGANVAGGVVAQPWEARLRSGGEAVGLGLRGKPSGKLEIGADLQLVRDKNEYNVQGATAALPAAVLLPDISTRRTTLKLFGQYALQSNLAVRVDFAHDRYHTNDWTWTDWAYADGTTVTQTPRTQVSLIGLSVIYRMW